MFPHDELRHAAWPSTASRSQWAAMAAATTILWLRRSSNLSIMSWAGATAEKPDAKPKARYFSMKSLHSSRLPHDCARIRLC